MRMRLALAAISAGTVLMGTVASAQAVPSAPDAIVSIRRLARGGDFVNVGMRSATYPPELLREQLNRLGTILGTGARAVTIRRDSFRPGDPNATLIKGSCGVDGLIDRTTGALNVQAIAQAFAGVPAPNTIGRLVVSFDGEVPGAKTIQRFTSPELSVYGRTLGSSVDYDVELKSQDSAKLVIPDSKTAEAAAAAAKQPAKTASKSADPVIYVLVVVAGVAAGALVYCLILMLGRRTAARP